MRGYSQFLVLPMVCLLVPWRAVANTAPISGTKDGSEQWGYIDVRPGAHMFWWLYRSTSKASNATTIPVIMWLQGGPGASGVGVGDFSEIGPLDEHLQPRKHSWVEIADLLFVENPVGTGAFHIIDPSVLFLMVKVIEREIMRPSCISHSYVDKPSLLPTNNTQVSSDLLQFLVEFVKLRPELLSDLSKRPLFIFSESYGGKFASELGVMVHKATAAGSLDLSFGGVALGDAWISPLDSMYSWGPFLYTNSRLDAYGAVEVKQSVDKTAEFMRNGQFENATYQWGEVEDLVLNLSNQVDFYNILNADEAASISSAASMSMIMKRSRVFRDYFGYFNTVKAVEVNETQNLTLPELMNTVIREKLKIIPASVRWQSSSDEVFIALIGDFMKDTIHQVDELLHYGVKVAVYSGQLDLICSTPGTEAWVQNLKWTGLEGFNKQGRTPLYCNSNSTGGFVKKYKNLSFYWVLKAGHYLPIDSPCVAQQMASLIMS